MASPTVKADIQHPSAHLTVTREPYMLYEQWEQVRVFLIENLDDASFQQSATMLARSLRAKIPQLGSAAPGTAGTKGCILINYTVVVISESDNSCYLLLTYKNPMPGQPSAIIVSDDTVLTTETTQLHPSDLSPMLISYSAPAKFVPPVLAGGLLGAAAIVGGAGGVGAGAGGAVGPGVLGQSILQPVSLSVTPDPDVKPGLFPATFKYSRPIRKVIISAYVVNKDLEPIRNAIGSVNNATWLKYDVGWWRLDEFRVDGNLSTGPFANNILKVTVGLVSRVTESFMRFEVFNSPDLGRRVTVPPKDRAALIALGYFYGWKSLNGIICAGLYPRKDFFALLGVR